MDAVSYAHSAKQAKRIKRFIENPDSNSGVLTQPKVIEAGETVTIKSGRQAILADTVVNGDLVIEAGGEMFVPAGSSVDFSSGITVNGEKLIMSIPTAYHIYNGSVEATNTEITNGFSTTLYTGNGTIQNVITGVDMATQWGDDASETFGGLVWGESRSNAIGSYFIDSIRGFNKILQSNTTGSEITDATTITSFNNNGFSVGAGLGMNTNLATYASWNFQTTHRRTGVTNHGKAYTEHYNPFTGFTIIKYEGSGLAGHEIPHSLGKKIEFGLIKNLTTAGYNWLSLINSQGTFAQLNSTNAFSSALWGGTAQHFTDSAFLTTYESASFNAQNGSAQNYILYGWTNSYYDESNKLIGNYEVGVYQGTGVVGNKVVTRGKPAWVMIKRLDSVENWNIFDNMRANGDNILFANLAHVEYNLGAQLDFTTDSFIIKTTGTNSNGSGGQYLYMVVYDNDSGSGKSKYPKATDTTNLSINALVPYANGIDVNGSKVSIDYKNETITGLTLTQGKNYPYSKNDGTYDISMVAPSYGIENPLTGDFFNLKTLKWYDNTNAEITPRTYLDCVVYADHNRQVTYVEELPKIEYKDIVKANEYQGKNACTAWVNFDATTTTPTIRDSYNVSAIVKIGVGLYDIYFKEEMDNTNYSACMATQTYSNTTNVSNNTYNFSRNKLQVAHLENSIYSDTDKISVHLFGGKN